MANFFLATMDGRNVVLSKLYLVVPYCPASPLLLCCPRLTRNVLSNLHS